MLAEKQIQDQSLKNIYMQKANSNKLSNISAFQHKFKLSNSNQFKAATTIIIDRAKNIHEAHKVFLYSHLEVLIDIFSFGKVSF